MAGLGGGVEGVSLRLEDPSEWRLGCEDGGLTGARAYFQPKSKARHLPEGDSQMSGVGVFPQAPRGGPSGPGQGQKQGGNLRLGMYGAGMRSWLGAWRLTGSLVGREPSAAAGNVEETGAGGWWRGKLSVWRKSRGGQVVPHLCLGLWLPPWFPRSEALSWPVTPVPPVLGSSFFPSI